MMSAHGGHAAAWCPAFEFPHAVAALVIAVHALKVLGLPLVAHHAPSIRENTSEVLAVLIDDLADAGQEGGVEMALGVCE
jgi:hypothetical protein